MLELTARTIGQVAWDVGYKDAGLSKALRGDAIDGISRSPKADLARFPIILVHIRNFGSS
jgi:hypothetical protein